MCKRITVAVCLLCCVLVACQSGRDKLLSKIKQSEKILISDSLRLNDSIARILVVDYQEFAKQYPKDKLAPEYLFKAGEVSNGLTEYAGAISILSTIPESYPAFDKAAESVFLCAFIAENSLQDTASAKMYYEEVINKYPNSKLKEQAELSIANMGKSLDELVKEFEAKNAQ